MGSFTLKDPQRIGVAVLGAGRMGRVHVRNLGTIPNANVIVVADPIADVAEAGRVLAGARRATTDPLDAINDPDVEAVVINTPTTTHATSDCVPSAASDTSSRRTRPAPSKPSSTSDTSSIELR